MPWRSSHYGVVFGLAILGWPEELETGTTCRGSWLTHSPSIIFLDYPILVDLDRRRPKLEVGDTSQQADCTEKYERL